MLNTTSIEDYIMNENTESLVLIIIKYLFSPRGRLGVLSWWIYQAFNLILLIIMAVLDGQGFTIIIIALLCYTNVIIGIKRLHDINFSGFWFLLIFLPAIGQIALLIMLGFIPGNPLPNKYDKEIKP